MNLYVPSEYIENIHRLALGIHPLDPVLERGVQHRVRIDIEHQTPHSQSHHKVPYYQPQIRGRLPMVLSKHESGRYTLLFYPGIKNEIAIRIFDYRRHYVPRRLSLPIPTLDDVIDLEADEVADYYTDRIREPVVFPGAAYDVCSRSTGLRGRVMRDGEPMRWAVVEARLPPSGGGGVGQLVGRGRGDDRGEFLLLITSDATPEGEIDVSGEVDIVVSIAGPVVIPAPGDPGIPEVDPFWDIPLETVPPMGDPANVLNGVFLPPDYQFSDSAQRTIRFQLGRIMTGVEVDDFVFSLP